MAKTQPKTKNKPKGKGRGRGKAKDKKPGGQPGNTNALKHGFYAKQFSDDENTRLNEQDSTDVVAEINLLRVYIDRIVQHTTIKEKPSDHDLKVLNTLSLMTQSISTLTRTHYLVRGKSNDVTDSIMRALEELRLEMGI